MSHFDEMVSSYFPLRSNLFRKLNISSFTTLSRFTRTQLSDAGFTEKEIEFLAAYTTLSGESVPTSFDYRKLLRKYINHVKECEGITFVPDNTNDAIRLTHHEFTQAELDELHRLEDEIATVPEAIIKEDTKI